MMLDNPREHGAEACAKTHVTEVIFDGDCATGGMIKEANGSRRAITARVVVDASGQAGLLQNRFKTRLWDPILNKGAIWTYWQGAYRDTGRDEGATMVLQTADRQGWFWYIPLHNDIMRSASWRRLITCSRTAAAEQTHTEEVERCSAVKDRVSKATRVTGYFATRDYSYRSTEVAGNSWVLIGDAFQFLDPLYSSGVLLALKSGELAADAIIDGFKIGDTSAAQLGRWGATFNEGVDRMRRLVCEYYAGFSFGKFVKNYPELTGVTDLLIGDLFTGGWTRSGSRWNRSMNPTSGVKPWHEGQTRKRPSIASTS